MEQEDVASVNRTEMGVERENEQRRNDHYDRAQGIQTETEKGQGMGKKERFRSVQRDQEGEKKSNGLENREGEEKRAREQDRGGEKGKKGEPGGQGDIARNNWAGSRIEK